MTYLNEVPEDNYLGDTGIAFIDNAVNKVKGLVQNQIQAVTERVADFKLLPRKHRELQARLALLQNTATVKANATWSQNVGVLGNNLSVAQGQWTVTNSTLDSALDQINAIKSGKVSASTLTMAASLISGMNDAFAKAKDIEKNVRAIELVALTPAQQQAALGVNSGGVSTSGMSVSTLALLLGGGYLLVRSMRK